MNTGYHGVLKIVTGSS